MNDLQRSFADAYLADPEYNQSRAYMSVYKSVKKPKTASTNASRLLKNKEIREYIDKRLGKMSDIKIADAKEVQEYLTSVMRGIGDKDRELADEDNIEKQGIAQISIPLKDRMRAAELLGKVNGIFADSIRVDKVPQIVDDIT